MFKATFSFEGRIRRTEYGLSYIIYMVIYLFLASALSGSGTEIIYFILMIPLSWFLFAQGAKRCHDLDRSGWYQIIPFYVLWMLFQDGQPGENEYGLNPKGIGNESSYDDQINEIGKSLES
jgi:uncharacterized membrane protein YhaH (DUF805 family)